MSNDTLHRVLDDNVEQARALLVLLLGSQPDPLERIVTLCALAHLDAHDPPRPAAEPARSPARGPRLLQEIVDALTAVVRDHTDPAERARASLALQELHTPLHFSSTGFEDDAR